MTATRILLGVLVLIAGCASFDGRGLVPGKSAAADVRALMGEPAEELKAAGGETVWFYPRMPYGRQSFAVRLGPDGVLRAVEQRLTVENVYKLVPGTTGAKEVRELLGPPWRVSHLERQQREVWEYTIYDTRQFEYFLYVQFSGDSVVREVLLLRDTYFEPGGTGSKG
jgi:outer membrane protein assembly factor BamE (lipoprotein component of BamABCDE complex)